MAFDNVFGNVDFGQISRARQGEADRLQKAIGLGIQQGQAKQDRELKERQLEMKANKFDLKQTSTEGYMTLAGGGQPTPEQIQAMDVVAAQMRPSAYLDPSGFVAQKQPVDPRSRLGQAVGQATLAQPSQAITDQDFESAPMSLQDINQALTSMPKPSAVTAPDRSPLARAETTKANVGLQEHAGKQEIEQGFEVEKEERALEAKKALKKPQEVLALESSFQEARNLNETIKKVYDSADNWTTGLVGQMTSGIGGTPAHDLAANLSTIHSDAGLSKLIEVKERGGTFGALQEKELQLLIDSRAALLQSQSQGQFKENLIKYQNQRNETMGNMAKFFDKKYGTVPEGLLEGLEENLIEDTSKKVFSPEQKMQRLQELRAKRGQ